MAEIDGTTTQLNELSRTYKFAAGSITLLNVLELTTRPSGTHRLKTADGHLHVVRSDWLSIEIDVESKEWTV